ncbi:Rv1535 family protein [Mycobacterium nebraskense]|uniref:Uncharacterized protein n=1 Tax=Mycobacterium nebraskense TaxID=244292 RepID=A0A0F5ND45_9MYCO|nr:Rv1535 family protein [Mycobacterium nebraskense]KKC04203.1 hypothetical protein WU83_14965 [Mycobacterium nebraskense]KLO41454.1 hypothetical protein ABW17_14565 [Mycobacterium nebraskense]MBI2697455.1 hypothetical protein [Mycobacterium nebraskense]MCV7118936.1 hypothetical protein [Mycobacterium nebraskense]ORW17446.1 hypothetical protein AWC17_12440 [Mycobacterium nebraskense]
MTAALYDEVVTVAPARTLTVVRDTGTIAAPAAKKATRRATAQPVFAGDPLVEGATRLLSIPLRHLYAVLLRVGVLEVQA